MRSKIIIEFSQDEDDIATVAKQLPAFVAAVFAFHSAIARVAMHDPAVRAVFVEHERMVMRYVDNVFHAPQEAPVLEPVAVHGAPDLEGMS